MHGIERYEHDELWTILSRRAAEIAVAKQAAQEVAILSPPIFGYSTCSSLGIRLGLRMTQDQSNVSVNGTRRQTAEDAEKEVETSEHLCRWIKDVHNGQEIFPDPP